MIDLECDLESDLPEVKGRGIRKRYLVKRAKMFNLMEGIYLWR